MQVTTSYSWYVPDYENNRELDKSEQIRIEVRPLKHKERLDLIDKDLTQEQFKNCIRNVEHLYISKTRVKTGRDLFELRGVPSSLISDIQNYITSISLLGEDFVALLRFAIRLIHDKSFHNFDCDQCTESDKEMRICAESDDIMINQNPDNGAMSLYSMNDSDRLDQGLGGVIWSDENGMITTYCCPKACINNEVGQLISIYNLCKDLNCLYNDGGLGEQSNLLIEAFSIISNESSKIDSERREKQ